MLSLNPLYAIQVDVPAMEARHASQLAALQEKLAAAQKQQEHAVSRLQKEQEAERERVKRAITELKKKLDRHVTVKHALLKAVLQRAWYQSAALS